jgi:hypothetical protein
MTPTSDRPAAPEPNGEDFHEVRERGRAALILPLVKMTRALLADGFGPHRREHPRRHTEGRARRLAKDPN